MKPDKYTEILVSVRTPGRCCVIEGPSGIGKTTVISAVLKELAIEEATMSLSARRPEDVQIIDELPSLGEIGTVIVDDFHRLGEDTKTKIGDYMKYLADTESEKSKLILLGINKTGQQLIRFAHDLGLRIDVFRLETNPNELIERLISQGEDALNVAIPEKGVIADRCYGSFQIAQLICHKICVLSGVVQTQEQKCEVNTSTNFAIEEVLNDLSRQFKEVATTFVRGSKIRREGRAPYLHILKWLADSDDWSVDLSEAMNQHPTLKGSVSQVLEKGHLRALLDDPDKVMLSQYFHFQDDTTVLSVEDPKLVFYIKNMIWRVFTKQAGFRANYFKGRYDVALSFAGTDRALASRISDILTEREVAVFYDFNEQHRIMAQNVEDYLAPIYRSEASYIVAILSPDYPTRIWTKFESDAFKDRFGSNEVIPVRFTTLRPGYFSEDAKYGGVSFDPGKDLDSQAQLIADLICKRLIEDRAAAADSKEEVADVEVV